MVDSKRYNPSNKRFQEHTQHFVEGTTRKGHLSKKKKGDKSKETGLLKYIIVAKLYEDGWVVDIDKKEYHCNYGDNVIYLPPHNVTANGERYVPSGKCKVDVSIDKATKIHTITKIHSSKKQPIGMTNDGVTLVGKGLASLKVTGDEVNVSGKITSKNDINTSGKVEADGDIKTNGNIQTKGDIKTNGNLQTDGDLKTEGKIQSNGDIQTNGDVKLNTKDDDDLPDEISIKDLYKRIQVLEAQQSSDNNDS